MKIKIKTRFYWVIYINKGYWHFRNSINKKLRLSHLTLTVWCTYENISNCVCVSLNHDIMLRWIIKHMFYHVYAWSNANDHFSLKQDCFYLSFTQSSNWTYKITVHPINIMHMPSSEGRREGVIGFYIPFPTDIAM